MAFSKKGTRAIHVDGVDYRWRVREGKDWWEASILVFATANPNGEPLSATASLLDLPGHAVTPSRIADLIRYALGKGWRPERRGSCPPCDDEMKNALWAQFESSA